MNIIAIMGPHGVFYKDEPIKELDLLIVMKRTTARPRPPMPASVWVQVDVADSPHLIERFTALFDENYALAA